jgi:bifunctional oligoribonuclease and PAP phosphatase NrnA
MNAQEIQYLKEFLSQPKQITIIPHRNPDGDALGSSLGLYHVLKQLHHNVTIVSPNEFPEFIAWLPASETVAIYEKNTTVCQNILSSSDLIFTLDFNAFHRTGDTMGNFLATLTQPFVMIDHHQMPDDYAKITVSDTSFGSTCELLYNWITELDLQNYINKDAATCIYTGIVTDSGSFKFVKTTGATHRVVADLIDRGVDNPAVHNALFSTSSFNRLQLLGRALSHLKVFPEHKTAYTYLTQQDLYHFNFQKGDTEGIVNYGLSIKGIDFAAIFIENKEEGIIKISFRSEGGFDVNEYSRNYFNGGGHINAAGGKSFSTLDETIATFEKTLQLIDKK